MKKLFYLLLFLFIPSVTFSQGIVTKRYDNGHKHIVGIFSGSGLSEKLIEKHYYRGECNNLVNRVEYFDSIGRYYKEIIYFNCSSQIYWSIEVNHNTGKAIEKNYKEDGTLLDGYPKEHSDFTSSDE